MSFAIKRIYEPAEKSDGIRVLVDRLGYGLEVSRKPMRTWSFG
jgi:uncharacterized protein YeaO (DUF488 family)